MADLLVSFTLPARLLTSPVAPPPVDVPPGTPSCHRVGCARCSARFPCIMRYFPPLVRCGIIHAIRRRIFPQLGNICILHIVFFGVSLKEKRREFVCEPAEQLQVTAPRPPAVTICLAADCVSSRYSHQQFSSGEV